MGFDELVQHDASELTKGTLPAERLPSEGVDADTLDGVDGSDYARTDQDETVSGKRSFNDDIAVDTDLLFIDVSLERIGVNNSGPKTAFEVNATSTFTTDATVSSDFFLSNKDLPASVGKMGSGIEFGPFGDSTGGKSAAIVPVSRDNSSSHPTALAFFTKASTSSTDPVVEQMRITEQGNVVMANKALIGATGAATNALDVSGGAVVGSGFAGSNTAPTDGLLVEGRVGINGGSSSKAACKITGDANPDSSLKSALRLSGSFGGGITFEDNDYAGMWVQNSGSALEIAVGRSSTLGSSGNEGNYRFDNGLLQVGNLTSQPGTPNAPVIEMGQGGAGFYIDSNGSVKAVDESGNTTTIV